MYSHGVEYSGAWNFGPKEEDINTVESMVKKINQFWGTGNYRIEKDKQQHEAELLKLDISKSNYYLKWKPVYNFDDSLKITLDWYRNYYIEESNMLTQTIEQIVDYTKKAEENGLKWTD